MTNTPLDELGPVDYVVVEFPAGAKNFTGEMAAELVKLVDAGMIRIVDVLILDKNEDGSVDATELSDIDQLGEMQSIEAELAELLAAEDVENLAAAMEPGSTAGVLIWRTCGRRRSRPPRDAREASSSPTDGSRSRPSSPRSRPIWSARPPKETEMPLRPARVGRVGVIGHPVARTAVVAKAVTPGPSPVAKTAVVAAAVTPGRGVRRRRI